MERILEKEIMDDTARAQAYARADFSVSNQWFVDHLWQDFPKLSGQLVDLGTGPGDVVVRAAQANPSLRITAVDGSEAMIRLAELSVRVQRLHTQITLLCARLPGLPLPDHSFDAVLSKDLLHHLPNPDVFWNEAKRLAKPGAALYVMDLFRPDTEAEARRMVAATSSQESPLLQEDFFNSLCAAFTPEEIGEQLKRAGLRLDVTRVSDRHMLIRGRAV
jgi:ubiquinone/menaquinone biosynthesis C-methylase UbiE